MTFGKLKDGTTAGLYSLKKGNMTLKATDYGATLVSLCYSGKEMLLSYETLQEYETEEKYLGATVGRTSGRIKDGRFFIDGMEYNITLNDKANSLHGGTKGFDKRLWNCDTLTENSVSFSLLSKEGEEGYPGNLSVRTVYTLTDDSLIIDHYAKTDKKTLCALTNHAYFNIAERKEKVYSEKLWILSDRFVNVDDGNIPTGFTVCKGTDRDFSEKRTIGKDYDDSFILSKEKDLFEKVAELGSSLSGVLLEVMTDLPCLQLYTGGFLERKYSKGDAVCLEAQFPPDAINYDPENAPILSPGEIYKHRTEYRFSILK